MGERYPRGVVVHNAWSYQRGKCRCGKCRADATAVARQQYESRKARLAADPSIRPHANAQTYNVWGCRCDPCCEAAALHARELRDARNTSTVNIFRVRPFARKPKAKPFGREWLDDSA